MGDVDKAVDAVWKRKKAIGLILLAVGALLWIKSQDQAVLRFLGVSSAPLAFFLMVAGIVLLIAKMSRRTPAR